MSALPIDPPRIVRHNRGSASGKLCKQTGPHNFHLQSPHAHLTERQPLTDRQPECVAVIRQHWVEEGCSPTLHQMCDEMGMGRNPSAAIGHLKPLVK